MRGKILFENIPWLAQPEGTVIGTGRPVIVISPRPWGDAVQVVPLTSSERRCNDEFDHHVSFLLEGAVSTALCEQVRTVDIHHLRPSNRSDCPEGTMKRIDRQVKKILGLEEQVCSR